jgi:hypothetical protein
MFEKDMMMVEGGKKTMSNEPGGGYPPSLWFHVISTTGNDCLPFLATGIGLTDAADFRL